MKLRFSHLCAGFTAAASLFGNGVSAKADTKQKFRDLKQKAQLKQDFLRAMEQENPEAMKIRMARNAAKRKEDMQRALLESAVKRKAQDENDWYNYNPDMSSMNFDMTSYSFKYAGCAAIKEYDVEAAEDNGEALTMNTYAVFRLCPSDSCNKYSITGCGKNYGEYVIDLATYLKTIMKYYETRYEEYCEYCYPCDTEYLEEVYEQLDECYENRQEEDQQQQQQQQENQNQNWEQYYNQNNGNMAGYNYNNANNAYNGNNGGNRRMANNQNNQYKYGYMNNNNNGGNNAQLYAMYCNQNQQQNQNQNQNGQNQNGNYGQYNGYYGNRKLQNNYYGYNGYNNGYNGNQDVEAQNGAGYYDANGNWVDANDAARNGEGFWGNDGVFYPCDGEMEDECLQEYYEQMLCDEYICGNYMKYCTDWYGEAEYAQQQDLDLYDYLSCTGIENDYGQYYYIGPHCGSDRYTISMGVFSDPNCLNYIGSSVSLASVVGWSVNEEDLFKLPKECINCDGTEDYEKYYEEQAEGEAYYGEGDWVVEPDDDETQGLIAMCTALYDASAQCDKHLTNYGYNNGYKLNNENANCNFIDNIVYGKYDEQGEIELSSGAFDFRNMNDINEYSKLRLPASQAVGLALSVLLVVALSASVIMVHRSLSRDEDVNPWKPRKKLSDPSAMSRQSSGIVLGRSRSGPNNAPLI